MNKDQVIPCPVCGEKIPIDTMQLLLGVQFKCPNINCDATIGLTTESKPIVKETMEKFEQVKEKLSKG